MFLARLFGPAQCDLLVQSSYAFLCLGEGGGVGLEEFGRRIYVVGEDGERRGVGLRRV